MPVPGPAELGGGGGVPEVFTTAHDALFTQAGLAAGERLLSTAPLAGWAPRRAAGGGCRRPGHGDGAQSRRARPVAELGATVIEPAGFAEHGPFDVSWSSWRAQSGR